MFSIESCGYCSAAAVHWMSIFPSSFTILTCRFLTEFLVADIAINQHLTHKHLRPGMMRK
jgi:hypothetical protein